MNKLSLLTLGPFRAHLNSAPLIDFRTRKVQALLIYLAIEPQAHNRDLLLDLLWPGLPERSARSNLRQIIYYLRQLFPVADDNDQPVVIVNRHTIQLNPLAEVEVDTAQFQALVDKSHTHNHLDLLLCADCGRDLERAVALYQGDFLSDFYLDDSNEYEEWAHARREHLRHQALDALAILATMATRQQNYAQSLVFARQQLVIDNLREGAYRQLMEALALSGCREEALAVYETCRRLLADELGMAPAARTTEYKEKITAGDLRFDRPAVQGVRGYVLKEQIGEGSYGTIHRALQPVIGREVAIKVIRLKYANDPEFIRRFEAEAQIIARLEHPHIVPLYDYWRDPEGAYLVMRYIRQGSLLTALQTGPWPLERAASLLDQIAGALSMAHQQGVVHRDIKPANILLDEAGNAYLTDFGIAKDLTREERVTDKGALGESLEYVSPEQVLGEPVSPQTDIYSLGAVLYETLTSEKPFAGAGVARLLHSHLHEPMPPVTASLPGAPAAIDSVLQKATEKNPANRYASTLALAEAFRRAVRGQHPEIVGEPRLALVEVYNPYKGIRAFQEADAADFFGREALVQQLLDRLDGAAAQGGGRFLAVVGPSGSGKSSVVKAGLIPALRNGLLPGSENWFITEMTPGPRPFESLELALWSVAVGPPPSLIQPMQRDTGGILRTIRRILPDTPGAQLLLVIDQFEELYTLVAEEEERAFFLEGLLTALTAPRSPLRLVVTLRADFYDRPLQRQSLGQLLKDNTEIVLPLNPTELTWAICEPARRMGVILEEGLASAIVAGVADQPGGLPLLQYAMTELFERRQDHHITRAAYQQIGGVQGALGRRAEAVYGELDEASQKAARQLFLRLVTLGEGTEDTRRRALLSELEDLNLPPEHEKSHSPPPAAQATISTVLNCFGAARFLTFDRDPLSRSPTVEVAHEALLSQWPRLRDWLAGSRRDVRMQRLLAAAAAEWQQAGQEAGYLLRGGRLDHFESWAAASSVALTTEEQAFLSVSLAARRVRRDEEEARRRRELETAQKLAQTERQRAEEHAQAAQRLRLRAAFLAGALVIVALLAVLALTFARSAVVAKQVAQQQTRLVTSRELAASALNNLSIDPERSILLALHSLSKAHTLEAENTLHRAIQASRVRLTLTGHNGGVWFVDVSPDGTKIATTSQDRTVKIWDFTTGMELLTLSGHTDETMGVNFSPDGTRLATASFDGTARVWDVNTGEELLKLTGHEAQLASIYYSPDGKRLVTTGNFDGMIIQWDANTGEELLRIQAHESGSWHAQYDPEGKRLATGGMDGMAKIWDVHSGELLLTLDSLDDRVVSRVAFSPDGAYLATAHDTGAAKIWDSFSGEELRSFEGHAALVIWVCFSPDGKRLATASIDGTAKIWDISSGDALFTLAGHSAPLIGMTFTRDGKYLITGSPDGTARVWDLTPTKEMLTLDSHRDQVLSIDFNSDGTRLASGSLDGTAIIWDVKTGQEQIVLGNPGDAGRIRAVAFSPDGARLATSSADGTITIWNAATWEELITLHGHAQGHITGFNGVIGIAFSPDGKLVATASDDNTAKIWDAASGKEIFTLTGHGPPPAGSPAHHGVNQVRFSPDGKRLATAGSDGTVKIWDAAQGTEILSWEPHPGTAVVDLAFSPDGTRLLTSGYVATVNLWDSETGQALLTLSGHANAVNGVAFTPGGKQLVTGSEDGSARTWDAETGEPLLALTGHSRGIIDIAVSPDGKYLVTSSYDGGIRFFVLPLDELINLAQLRLTRSLTEEECYQFLHVEECPAE